MGVTRSTVVAIAVTTVLASCGAPSPPDAPADGPAPDDAAVRFETREVVARSTSCEHDGAACARFHVVIAEPASGGSEDVRDNLDMYARHWLVSRLREHLSDGAGGASGSFDDLAAAFLAQHLAFTAEFPEAPAEWFIEAAAEPIHSSAKVATLDLSVAAYTGGAHPNSQRRLVSFAVPSGQLLGADDLTPDVAELTAAVEERFRDQRGLGADDDLEAAGFWFPGGTFELPDNLGVVADGLLVHWNAYEVAPYSMGPTTVLVPASDLADIVTLDVW